MERSTDGSRQRMRAAAKYCGSSRSAQASLEIRLRTPVLTESSMSLFTLESAATWGFSSRATWQQIFLTMFASVERRCPTSLAGRAGAASSSCSHYEKAMLRDSSLHTLLAEWVQAQSRLAWRHDGVSFVQLAGAARCQSLARCRR